MPSPRLSPMKTPRTPVPSLRDVTETVATISLGAPSKRETAREVAARFENDMLLNHSSHVFGDAAMKRALPGAVYARFKRDVREGRKSSKEDEEVVAEAVFGWARELGATSFAHWFFPTRFGSGAAGGTCGALKCDAFIDMAKDTFETKFPASKLFGGESDGSSFPNGGLRKTHAAAGFTTWDRSSPLFVLDGVLRIPAAFVSHDGKCLDDKTPLLRSVDALDREGRRLLGLMNIHTEGVDSYLGWEQEFFVVSADLFKKRPDLLNCGRTLIGKLPATHQQSELHYFAPPPQKVEHLMTTVQAKMLEIGSPMAVRHNEVAPGQHEMSPIFTAASASCDANVAFMEICRKEASKLNLAVLFHEKPFKGINGSGKHSNWSVQTREGLNLFHPGDNEESKRLFVASLACLAYGLNEYNELVRVAVASSGNDHRLGAQEAPPAIISFYPGPGFEKHVDSIIKNGAPLVPPPTQQQGAEKKSASSFGEASPKCRAASPVQTSVEDRNRTAPFPFCGNRFEFRAVGSSQNCAFPVTICNVVMAAGMRKLSDMLENQGESGFKLRDAVAQLYAENRRVIFCGDGYSSEWPEEASKRGLPNLRDTPRALRHFATEKNTQLLKDLGVFQEDETQARADILLENYVTSLVAEIDCFADMVRTGIIPACAKDLALYVNCPQLGLHDRQALYADLYKGLAHFDTLRQQFADEREKFSSLQDQAEHLCDVLKPQMDQLRALVDKSEGLLHNYPFPTYQALLYDHHF